MQHQNQSALANETGMALAAGADQRLHSALPAEPVPDTNQAERAAMHPEGHELEWGYYHGACYA